MFSCIASIYLESPMLHNTEATVLIKSFLQSGYWKSGRLPALKLNLLELQLARSSWICLGRIARRSLPFILTKSLKVNGQKTLLSFLRVLLSSSTENEGGGQKARLEKDWGDGHGFTLLSWARLQSQGLARGTRSEAQACAVSCIPSQALHWILLPERSKWDYGMDHWTCCEWQKKGTQTVYANGLFFPVQKSNTWTVFEPEGANAAPLQLLQHLESTKSVVVGWIHSHPSWDAFFSSLDQRQQYSLQKDADFAFGLVVGKDKTVRCLRLNAAGMDAVAKCQHSTQDLWSNHETIVAPSNRRNARINASIWCILYLCF